MSNESEPINITINVSDTVPLSLYRAMEVLFEAAVKRSSESDNAAAELRIEVAALTVAKEIDETRIKGLHQKIRDLEAEKRTLLEKIVELNKPRSNRHA